MKALLDTNIIIHRENSRVTNDSIGSLFYWLDTLHYDKMIHPYSIEEIKKYRDENTQKLLAIKLNAYVPMNCVAPQTKEFKELLIDVPKTENDAIDNQLLFEVFSGRADILITEDRRMRLKAERLGILEKVFSIDSFIIKATNDNPALVDYKVLSVKKEFFGNIDINDSFFDSLKEDYPTFSKWFARNSNEEAYICRNESGKIIGFLSLKTENEDDDYSDITPKFLPKKRLKVRTFKVEASGFRLGERFIRIIFDNAIERKVNEIYVTMFTERDETNALKELLLKWGFFYYGEKFHKDSNEQVFVKRMGSFLNEESIQYNFPNLRYEHQKLILPIYQEYHSRLFPDSKLNREIVPAGEEPQKYALQKTYISFSFKRDIYPGDFVLVYCPGNTPGRKGYESVLTTLGVVQDIYYDFFSKEEFLQICENRSVFSKNELEDIWIKNGKKVLVVKFILVGELKKKVTLNFLWEKGIIKINTGPRPFDDISDDQFDMILNESETKFYIEQGR